MLEKLRDIAIHFQIDPEITVGHAPKVSTVIKVLTELNKSFSNFLEVEFLKNEEFKKALMSNKNVLNTIKEELELLIVDLNYSSFGASVAPNLTETQPSLFRNEVKDWEKETFETYKDLILEGDYQEPKYIQKISKRYTDEERQKIYYPLFSAFGNGNEYSLKIKDNQGHVKTKLIQPQKEQYAFYVPKPEKKQKELLYKTVQVFAKVKSKDDTVSFTKQNIKQVYHIEELEHETYPFKPNVINFDGLVYILSQKLDCEVEYDDESYVIRNNLLDITVWGETREEVENAFNFSFHALHSNFALENDGKLSDKSNELKTKLLRLVKSVLHETQKG